MARLASSDPSPPSTPPDLKTDHRKIRSLIWVNTRIPSSNWRQISIDCPDLTAVEVAGEYGTLRIFNIYNDCDHNDTLTALDTYLSIPDARRCANPPLHYMWCGDFNRHDASWDEMRNHHLLTARNQRLAQPLLDLIIRYGMAMALPPGIPTLRAFSTGNLTRVDNVFVSPALMPTYVKCDAIPEWKPPKTDHFPIIQELGRATHQGWE